VNSPLLGFQFHASFFQIALKLLSNEHSLNPANISRSKRLMQLLATIVEKKQLQTIL
jgi:hypothetical protein